MLVQNYTKLIANVCAGGNAYNQLAVLASYEGDDLAAAFFYIR